MHEVMWSGRAPDAKVVELLRSRGVRVVDRAGGPVVAEIVTIAGRAAPANGVPWIWFASGGVSADDAGAAVARRV